VLYKIGKAAISAGRHHALCLFGFADKAKGMREKKMVHLLQNKCDIHLRRAMYLAYKKRCVSNAPGRREQIAESQK
jgi:hypothetical protein